MLNAYERYRAHFRRRTYQAVAAALRPFTDDDTHATILGGLTAAALECCGEDAAAGATARLTRRLVSLIHEFPENQVGPLITAVGEHLRAFGPPPDRAQQTHPTSHLLVTLHLASAEQALHRALLVAADIPGWQHVTGYYLLAAAWRLLHTAGRQTSGDHTPTYIAESLQRALGALDLALREWQRHGHDVPPVVALTLDLLDTLTSALT